MQNTFCLMLTWTTCRYCGEKCISQWKHWTSITTCRFPNSLSIQYKHQTTYLLFAKVFLRSSFWKTKRATCHLVSFDLLSHNFKRQPKIQNFSVKNHKLSFPSPTKTEMSFTHCLSLLQNKIKTTDFNIHFMTSNVWNYRKKLKSDSIMVYLSRGSSK